MEKKSVSESIKDYEKTDYTFTDYTYFEGDSKDRKPEIEDFKSDIKYAPAYVYSKLKNLQDKKTLSEKKTAITEAVLELEQLKKEPAVDDAEVELYIATFENRLKKIDLVQAAAILNGVSPIDSDYQTATESYMSLNREVYGEFDNDTYLGMLASERDRLTNFEPKNDIDREINDDLSTFFESQRLGSEIENELLDESEMTKLHDYIMDRYGPILSVVPQTSDQYFYDAHECQQIMQDALFVGGLSQVGWKVVINPAKSNVSTSGEKKIISLPDSTSRNASQLRRLILHEQEVHARRAVNGKSSGFDLLSSGTADYADIEEGLGVLLECALEGNFTNASFDRARYRYITAGLALGIGDSPRDGRSVYEILWRMIAVDTYQQGGLDEASVKKCKEQAYSLVENAFRSTDFTMRGVIYLKLKIYYEGLKKNADFIKKHIDSLDETFDLMMIGKYNHTDESETENVIRVIKNNQER